MKRVVSDATHMSAICTSTKPPPTTQPDVAAITGLSSSTPSPGTACHMLTGKILHVGADRKIRLLGSGEHRDAIVAVAKPQPGLAQLIAQGVVERIMRGAAIHGDGGDVAGALVANKCHGAPPAIVPHDSGVGVVRYFFSAGSRCTGSTHNTVSGFSTGSMSRLIATASPSLRTSTHSRTSSRLALISWCGT